MNAYVEERTEDVHSDIPGIRYAHEGVYNGYIARCEDCGWSGTFHAIGLESAPNWEAILDTFAHNSRHHA